LEKARACSGLIFLKLKSLAAAARAMGVHFAFFSILRRDDINGSLN
jgi:hypothetical protein